jgi:hypothetical protein
MLIEDGIVGQVKRVATVRRGHNGVTEHVLVAYPPITEDRTKGDHQNSPIQDRSRSPHDVALVEENLAGSITQQP